MTYDDRYMCDGSWLKSFILQKYDRFMIEIFYVNKYDKIVIKIYSIVIVRLICDEYLDYYKLMTCL